MCISHNSSVTQIALRTSVVREYRLNFQLSIQVLKLTGKYMKNNAIIVIIIMF